MSLLVPKVSTF